MCHGFWLCNQCNVKGKVVLIPVHPCHVCLVKCSVVRRDCRQVAAAGLSSGRRPSACLRFKSSIGASSTEFVSVQPSRLPSQHVAVYIHSSSSRRVSCRLESHRHISSLETCAQVSIKYHTHMIL